MPALSCRRVADALIRTHDAGLLEHFSVPAYGTPTPLNQVASMAVADPRLITIKPWEKSLCAEIEKSIKKSDLGLNPVSDGELVRVPIPALTEERRKEYVKVVKNMAEDARIAVRNIRRDARKSLETAEKNSEISKDDLERAEKELEKLTQDHVANIDKAVARKEQELLEV